jgi:hypothetical protein
VIPAGVVTDAAGNTTTVRYELSGTQLTVGVDPAWLRAPDRVFPELHR